MSWRDLIATESDSVTYPWTGGREIRAAGRVFKIKGTLPPEHGWHLFKITGGRVATWEKATEVDPDSFFTKKLRGYLVADRLISDQIQPAPETTLIVERSEPVWLVEPGLERFARIRVGRWEDGRLIYLGQEFPLGPEEAVLEAFQDKLSTVSNIPHVTPALDIAFRFETWNRAETIRLREEAERLAREEAARLELEQRRTNLIRQLGDGAGRRAMAQVDFEKAASAALRIGGAELLDWRNSTQAGEAIVQFRYQGRRFECVCNKNTLSIIDAGVCLVNHATGERGDTKFTLESLPGVIGEAIRERKLVVFRHVHERGGYVREDDEFYNEEEDDYE